MTVVLPVFFFIAGFVGLSLCKCFESVCLLNPGNAVVATAVLEFGKAILFLKRKNPRKLGN